MKDTETSHFWIAHFPSVKRLAQYFVETYGEEDDEGEEMPISQFARDQGEIFYDHDFLEYVFGKAGSSVEAIVAEASYHEQWEVELARRAADAPLRRMNAVVFISADQISEPRSVVGDRYELRYVGTISYKI